MTAKNFTFYAWRLSWYSAKVRAYLQYKGVDYTEKKPSLYTFKYLMPKHCHDSAVPVVVTPEGQWLMDSSVILEHMETRYPASPMLPSTPVQRLFSLLVEMWVDEFWHHTSTHYRFSFPGAAEQWRDEVATLLPGFPRKLQHAVVNHYYKYMVGVTERSGVVPDTFSLIENWTETQLDALESHFASSPFLLGERATLGDYALMGPIFGHLCYDPYPARTLLQPRPQLRGWVERMSTRGPESGELLAGDELPAALQPFWQSIFSELLPYLETSAGLLPTLSSTSPRDTRYQRMAPLVEVSLGDGSLQRMVMPYALWMLQRVHDEYARMSEPDAAAVRQWLNAVGGDRILAIEIPRVRRVGLSIAPEIALRS